MPFIRCPDLKPGGLGTGKRRVAPLRASAIAFWLIACAVAHAGDAAYMMRMKFHMGETRKYETSISWSLEPIGASAPPGAPEPTATPLQTVSSQVLFKVVGVRKDGGAEMEVTTVSGKNLQGLLPRRDPPMRMTSDARGRLLSFRRPIAAHDSIVGNSIVSDVIGSSALGGQGAALPKDPVRIGGKWTESVYMPHIGTGKVEGVAVKVEKVGEYKALLLHYVATMPAKTMLDTRFQPTSIAANAAFTTTEPMVITFDDDFSISDGALMRASGSGAGRLTPVPKDRGSAKTGASKPKPPPSSPLTINVSIGTELVD